MKKTPTSFLKAQLKTLMNFSENLNVSKMAVSHYTL